MISLGFLVSSAGVIFSGVFEAAGTGWRFSDHFTFAPAGHYPSAWISFVTDNGSGGNLDQFSGGRTGFSRDCLPVVKKNGRWNILSV